MRLHDIADLANLGHEFLVDRQTAGGVNNDDVAAGVLGLDHGGTRHRYRVTGFTEDRHTYLGAECAELLDGCGSLQVGADEKRIAALALEPQGEFAGVGGFTCTLQAGHKHDGGWLGRIGDLHRLATKCGDEFFVNDLDDLLCRVQRLVNGGAHSALAHTVSKSFNDRDVDVGFEQRDANLAQRLVDIFLAELALAAQPLEDVLKTIG